MSDSGEPAAPFRRVTVRDLAAHAGVSKSLVSLVLRDSPAVSPERRAAVLQAIDELGYRPRHGGGSLPGHTTPPAPSATLAETVAVVIDDLRNPWFHSCLDGIDAMIRGAGHELLLADQRRDLPRGESFLRWLLAEGVAGVVVLGSGETATLAGAARHLPVCYVGARDLQLGEADVVANDDERGAELATRHLLGLGHRRIAHVAQPALGIGRLRMESFMRTMSTTDLAGAAVIEIADPTEDGGYRAAIRLMSRPTPPTAVFAVNDVCALGVLSALQDLGHTVPRDVSVVGYDNTDIAALRYIGLTSVDYAAYTLGERAGRLLLDRIGGLVGPARLELTSPELVVRRTTAPPPP